MSFSPIFLYFDWFSINKWVNYFYFSSVSPMFKLLYEWNFFLARWIFLLWDFFIHKIRVAKGGTQLSGCQIATSRECFCDFGRKLENLSLPVYSQWCSATDGRTRLHEPRMARWTPVTSLRENLTQTHLDFSYFRTTEPKLTPALRKMPLTDLRHTIGTGDLFHKQTNIW